MIVNINTTDYVELNQFKETYTVHGKAAKELTENGMMEYDSLCEMLLNVCTGLQICDNCSNIAHRNDSLFHYALCDVCKD